MEACLCCGKFIEKGAIYCDHCGDWCFTPLVRTESEDTQEISYDPDPYRKERVELRYQVLTLHRQVEILETQKGNLEAVVSGLTKKLRRRQDRIIDLERDVTRYKTLNDLFRQQLKVFYAEDSKKESDNG